jgi:hypothetical protein
MRRVMDTQRCETHPVEKSDRQWAEQGGAPQRPDAAGRAFPHLSEEQRDG